MKTKLLLALFFIIAVSMKNDKPAYQFFDKNGKQVKYSKLLEDAKEADIIFFGELHNNPVNHWLQLELTKDIFKHKKPDLILGAEMFETDNQLIIDEYLASQIKTKNFENEAKLWNNYKTDYKPIVEFAKENNIAFIATNIPRRYASIVHKKGFEGLDSLNAEAKALIAPLPVKYDPELKGYKSMIKMMGGMGAGHANSNLPKAQAIKDATMSYFILKNWSDGKTFIHFNGTYHSNNFEGIVWYLKQENPDLKILTIASTEQAEIDKLSEESFNLADYILCIPESMTKTY
ncbi:MAG: ChaN family lipoprotein [Bacteroidales bacterium]|nr:ChaN family lipoprotein [Bacteroidales bacterium]